MSSSAPRQNKILIDTDPGQDIDDLLAVHFALLQPELDVRAITTVTRPAAPRARLVKRLLRYMDRTDIPVGVGMDLPLCAMSDVELAKQNDPRETMNHACFAEPHDPRDDPREALNAVDLIVRTIEAHPGEVTLACIAPLTNIACALRSRPDLAKKIKAIALMGGEIHLNRAEHNVTWDYVATDIVLQSGVPIAMGTWSVTRKFHLTNDDIKKLAQHPAPVNQALARAIDIWQPVHHWKPGPVMYDIFPMIWPFDRDTQRYYTTKPTCIRLETQGQYTRGMTIPAWDQKPNVELTTEANVQALRDLYLQTVLQGADP